MELNLTQQNHLKRRLDEILTKKKSMLRTKFLVPGVELSNRKRAELLKRNLVKVKRGVSEIKGHHDVVDVFDFSKFEFDESFDQKGYEKASWKVELKAAEISDEIVLGSAKTARKLISEFSKL